MKLNFFSSADRRGDISRAATTTTPVLPIVTATSNASVSAAKSWQSDTAATGLARPAATTVPCDAAASATHQAAATAASGAAGPEAGTARSSHGLRRSSSESRPVVGRHQELRHTATTGKFQILHIFFKLQIYPPRMAERERES